jgi:hypothetical protein
MPRKGYPIDTGIVQRIAVMTTERWSISMAFQKRKLLKQQLQDSEIDDKALEVTSVDTVSAGGSKGGCSNSSTGCASGSSPLIVPWPVSVSP